AIYQIGKENIRMVEVARAVGASAQFSGSGGAIVGTYTDDAMFTTLKGKLEPLGIKVLKPQIV
ncbi:MAG: GHMP kinase, partial [Kiritimatiellaeota bacterium]|nr:GHMP kinase [Kiritimatiellota bacterium]